MSSFFDDASLVMIPSGYKDGTVYSVKPIDGSGDLTFTRSNDTATRVGPDGLIEKVRTNLILQSQDFTTSWATNAAPTITANTTVAPDGTTTADTIASSAASSGAYQVPTVASGVEYSFSVSVKNITSATNIQIGCDLGPTNGFLNFNAVTGAITSTAAGITGSSVTNAGNGWYRVSGTYVSSGTANTLLVFGQSGMSFAVWGAQLETGVTTDYIATTTAAVSVGPVANLPRLDYSGGATCPKLLLEPQRTNVLTYSEQFDNAGWTKSDATITANTTATLDPSGYYGSDKLVENTANSVHRIAQTAILTSGQVYTQSVFAKDDGSGRYLRIFRASSTYNVAVFNLTNGTISSQSGSNLISAKIEAYGNNWYRCSITFTAAFSNIASYIALQNDLNDSYTGDGTSGIFIYGAALELGSYATSYIPTLAATTRGADGAYKASISTLIGQTEGVAFIDFVWNGLTGTGSYPRVMELWEDSSNYLQLYTVAGDADVYWEIKNAGVVQFTGNTSMSLGNNKIAIGYKLNDMVIYKNGSLIASDATCTVPSTSALGVAGSYSGAGAQLAASVKQTLLFTTRLSNDDLAALTA